MHDNDFIAFVSFMAFLLIIAVFAIFRMRNFYISKLDKPAPKPTSNRRQIKDVKPGEKVRIEWSRICGKIGYLTCLNNDPETRKILLEVNWSNWEETKNKLKREQIVLDYDSEELQNFHLLNQVINDTDTDTDENDISTLQKKMNEALEKEEYEVADELQKKIDKLLKNK